MTALHTVTFDFFVLDVGNIFYVEGGAKLLTKSIRCLSIEEHIAIRFAAGIDKDLIDPASAAYLEGKPKFVKRGISGQVKSVL